ncbi:acetate kinase [Crenobacter caeni]|uniref:Acetate kinase n=1 Tax=Crenobacter caeni TaxID=2705474 RepID=A0A6B2KN47_9NEIS|nr:acetate kinase [Crenobacter caeni]NDV11227.1 acetate kinase [Crenobacter caeni]
MHEQTGTLALLAGSMLGLAAGHSHAAPTLAEQVRLMREQMQAWDKERAANNAQLKAQQQRIQQLEQQLGIRQTPAAGQTTPAASLQARTAPATAEEGAPHQGNTPAVSQTPRDSNPASQARVEQIAQTFDVPGVLTPKGQWTLEPALQYSYSSSNRVALLGYTIIPAITVGLIDVRRVNRDSWIASVTGRYGLSNRLELEGRLPYVYQSEDSIQRPLGTGSSRDEVFNTRGHGIGDAELGLRYQFNQPVDGGPYFIGSLRVKSDTGKGPFDVDYVSDIDRGIDYLKEQPTGSGFWGYQLGVSAILPSDPAVLFGSLNYTWNQKYDVNQTRCARGGTQGDTCKPVVIGEVDPGDVMGFSVGAGIAINEKSSISFSYEHNVVGKTKFNGQTPPDAYRAQVGMFQIGYAYRLNELSTLNLNIGIGATEDSPDAQIALRMPYNIL